MRILISGAGIAGPTLAYWLLHYGFEVTIVEVSPRLRTGGYVIDFWGSGFDIAEKMGLLPQITRAGYKLRELRVVNREGKRVAGFPVASFFRLTRDRYASIPRSDLAAFIFHTIENRAETIFDATIDRIEQRANDVAVVFSDGSERKFDLVIGADGLHSRVRELAFGPEEQFEKYLGYKAAAFQVDGYSPRDELAYILYTEVGQQVGRFSMRDDRTLFLFTFADPDPAVPSGTAGQRALLRRRFGESGWECRRILDAMERSTDLYVDRVSQIHMGGQQANWTKGRIALIGDAAFCVSLLAGQGSALSMIAAYILAGELHRAQGNYAQAFARYEGLFGPFVLSKQKAALRFAGSFAPKSRSALFLRNRIFNLMAIPGVAELAIGRSLADKITLPDY